MIFNDIFIAGLAAFVICLALTAAARKLAGRVNLIDRRGSEARKDHAGNPALVGGISIFASLLLVSCFTMDHQGTFLPLLLGMFGYLCIGVYDDARYIPALSKLALQFILTLFLVIGLDVNFIHFGYLFSDEYYFSLGHLNAALTVIFILAYVNAFNFIDGLDGLAGTVALTSLLLFLAVSVFYPFAGITGVLAILICAIAGFLALNMRSPWRRKAAVFLGDGGSLALSFAIAWLAILFTNQYAENITMPPPIVYAFLLAYPVFDMVAIMLWRLMSGQSVFVADTQHTHHLLKSNGVKIALIPVIIGGVSLAYGGAGLLLWYLGLSQILLLLFWFCLFFIHLGGVALLRRKT